MISKVLEIVKEAGDKLDKHFGNIEPHIHKEDHGDSAVTKLDIKTEEFLVKKLAKIDPNTGFHGEELGVSGNRERYWLLDPIDGTAHFIRGLPLCTVMVALVERNLITLSVIYNFASKEMFWAEKGKGAKMNGKTIKVNKKSLKEAYIVLGLDVENRIDIARFKKLAKKCSWIRIRCVGYEYALIASGRLEGKIAMHGAGKDWDYGPGSLLVQEAGGVVANIGKTTFDFKNRSIIAANQVVFKQLTEGEDAIFPIRT